MLDRIGLLIVEGRPDVELCDESPRFIFGADRPNVGNNSLKIFKLHNRSRPSENRPFDSRRSLVRWSDVIDAGDAQKAEARRSSKRTENQKITTGFLNLELQRFINKTI